MVGSFTWAPKKENLMNLLNSKNFGRLHSNNINLTIIGNADSSLVKEINSNFKGVKMTGRVENVDSFYRLAKIAIVPEILGGGFKLKVAEAALQKSAIFSIKGAITKCNLIKNKHFIEAEDADDLIDKIITFQNHDDKLNVMIDEAYKIAQLDFTKNKFENDILEIINSRQNN